MQSMALSNEMARLAGISDELRKAWADTQAEWRDANSEHFESEHIAPLLMEISNAQRATEHLTQILTQAYTECTEW